MAAARERPLARLRAALSRRRARSALDGPLERVESLLARWRTQIGRA